MNQNEQEKENFQECQQQQLYQKDQKQQQRYIKSAQESYLRKSFLPSYEVKYQLGLIREKLLLEKDKVMGELTQQRVLEETIGEEELGLYKAKKRQAMEYHMAMGVVSRVKGIYSIIDQELQYNILLTETNNHEDKGKRSNQQLQNQHLLLQHQSRKHNSPSSIYFQHEQHAFTHLIQSIEQFNTFYSEQYEIINNNNNHNDKQKKSFLSKLYASIIEAVAQKRSKEKKLLHNKLQLILKKHNLPIRRNQKPKDRESTAVKMQQAEIQLLQRLLHWQACEFALNSYLSALMTSTTNTAKQGSNQSTQSLFPYTSQFFTLYYEKLQSSISYLFIETHQSHSFSQPNWMFEYLQEVFVANYQWLRENILVGLKGEIEGNILVYIFQYALEKLFYNNIKQRLQSDLSTPQFTVNPIFYYKFIDSLYELQEKLNITFSQRLTLVESILLQFELTQKKNNFHILQKCFEYQHQWMQQKIFKDFWQNINYSNIDLKNIETYNIVVNFNVLFEKLYTKFSSVYEGQLVSVINAFYQSQIRNLVAHIKTSLQRIYYHSGLDKLSVILAFKRVDNQFRSGLGQFISTDLGFQKQIKKQYYDYIHCLFNELGIQLLSVYSRKLLKGVTQLQHLLNANSVTQQEHALLIHKSQQIFKKWSHKMQQLNLVYPIKDTKIKSQFFVFLQSITFTEKGIMLFLQFYQPFLKTTYGFEQFNLLKMVILMDKKEQLQYLKLNSNGLSFLLETEYAAIRKMTIK